MRSAVLAALCATSTSMRAAPSARPAPAQRKFVSASVDALISSYLPRFTDPNLGTIFSNALPNSLDTTIITASSNDSYVITGDIDAMWLRDSTNEVLPYMAFAAQDAALAAMLRGVVMRQVRSVRIDAYANAFNQAANGNGHQDDPRTPKMTPPVFEGKYELDSLAAVLKSSFAYWNATRDASLLAEDDWLAGMEAILATITLQQQSTAEDGPNPAYKFARPGSPAYPNQPAARTGMSKCGFRPSDDNTFYPFLISANAMAAVELDHLAQAAAAGAGSRIAAIGLRAAALATQLRAAVGAFAPQLGKTGTTIYAYEVDGFGNFSFADDSNVPSLLSLPYLGFCAKDDPLCEGNDSAATTPEYLDESSRAGAAPSPHAARFARPRRPRHAEVPAQQRQPVLLRRQRRERHRQPAHAE